MPGTYIPPLTVESLEGYQLVDGQLFIKHTDPIMTIWDHSIAFNIPCYKLLNNCDFINVFVNHNDKRILITTALSSDQEAIRWIKTPGIPKGDHLECTSFTRNLFEIWKLDKKLRYKATGRLVQIDKKVMLLFDFGNPIPWDGRRMVKSK